MVKDNNLNRIQEDLWRIKYLFRGAIPSMVVQDALIAFSILRRIDCMIGQYARESEFFYNQNNEKLTPERLTAGLCEISGGYPFYNYSGYRLNDLIFEDSSFDMVLKLYLQCFSGNILAFLEGINFRQTIAILNRQPRYFVELIRVFADMDLSVQSVSSEEFYYLVASLIYGHSGFDSTPAISTIISECLMSDDIRRNEDEKISIYDPTCGFGVSLINAGILAKKYLGRHKQVTLYGQDINISSSAIASALVLLSDYNGEVLQGNTLTQDLFLDQHFQYILAEFPIGAKWGSIKDRIEWDGYSMNGRYSIGIPNTNDSQFLFIQHILSKMDRKGARAAFITSGSVLYNGNASSGESRVRRWLFENDMVETIIALPTKLVSSIGIPLYLWVLSNKKRESLIGKVRLIDSSSLNSNLRRKSLEDEVAQSIINEYRTIAPDARIIDNDEFGFYEVKLLENGKFKETVTVPLNTDIECFVATERQPFSNHKITVDYSSVEKSYSVFFDKYFRQSEVLSSAADKAKTLLSLMDEIESLKLDILKVKDTANPHAWKMMPLPAVAKVISGSSPSKDIPQDRNGLPLLTVPYLRGNFDDNARYKVMPRYKCVTSDDVIMISRGANAGEIFRGQDGILTSTLVGIQSINENVISPRYLYYMLKGYEKELSSMAKGSAIQSIDLKSFSDFKCMVPPLAGQRRIVSYLDRIVSKLDQIIESIGGGDNVFTEFRQVLIENAVHGRIVID